MSEKKIYCTHCGKELSDQDQVCESCGTKVNEEEHLFRDFLLAHTKDKFKGDVEDKIYETVKNWLLSHLYGTVVTIILAAAAVTSISSVLGRPKVVNMDDRPASLQTGVGTVLSDAYDNMEVTLDEDGNMQIVFTAEDAYMHTVISDFSVNTAYTILTYAEIRDIKITKVEGVPVVIALTEEGVLLEYVLTSGNYMEDTFALSMQSNSDYTIIRLTRDNSGQIVALTDGGDGYIILNNGILEYLNAENTVSSKPHFDSLSEWLASDDYTEFVSAYHAEEFEEDNGNLVVHISNMGKMDSRDLIMNSEDAYERALYHARNIYNHITEVTDITNLSVTLIYYEDVRAYYIEEVTFTFPE